MNSGSSGTKIIFNISSSDKSRKLIRMNRKLISLVSNRCIIAKYLSRRFNTTHFGFQEVEVEEKSKKGEVGCFKLY